MRTSVVYRGVDNRICGRQDGPTFVRRCKSRHFLQRPRAISIDAAALDVALQECSELRVVNEETLEEFVISAEEFRAAMKEIDRGFGRQYMVPLDYWRRAGHPQPSRPAPAVAPSEEAAVPVQLPLL